MLYVYWYINISVIYFLNVRCVHDYQFSYEHEILKALFC